jgi:replicative DNA helicase
VVTLAETLERTEQLDGAGGLAYLGTLVNETPSAANIKAYAKIVRETSVLRQMIATGTEIADSAYNPSGREVAELLDEAERRSSRSPSRSSGAAAASSPSRPCSPGRWSASTSSTARRAHHRAGHRDSPTST